MTIPKRYRRTHPAWGVGLIVGVPLVLFGLAWAASWAPRWVGLSPSDAELRALVVDEGAPLVTQVKAFIAAHERPPRGIDEIDADTGVWSLINHGSGLMLVRTVGPDEVLEYVFDDPRSSEEPGWYRRSESGPRYVLKLETPKDKSDLSAP